MTLRNLPRLGFPIVRFIFEAPVRSLTQAHSDSAGAGPALNNPVPRYHFNIGLGTKLFRLRALRLTPCGYVADKPRGIGQTQGSSSSTAMEPLNKDSAGRDYSWRNGQLGFHLLSSPFPA